MVARKRAKEVVEEVDSTNGIKFDYEAVIGQIEVAHKLTSTELSKDAYRLCALSTGNLMMDLMLGGGIMPAWNTIWGGEGSCKSTTVMSISANVMDLKVPLFTYFDYEQALDAEYFTNILSIINPEASYDQIFGVRNFKNPSKFDVKPRIHYYPHDVGEDFYLSMGELLRLLPDKTYLQSKWWYVFPNTKQGRANAGPKYDKNMYRQYKQFYVEAPDGGRLQMLMVIDSIQAMNPENQETGDLKKAMAQDARMHSAHLKKVRGKLRKKHCAVLAIGQLRVNPGQMFGNPEYSSGGNTIKHAADVRQKHSSRSSPNGGGPIEKEPSMLLEGAEDQYKYIAMKNEKNKFFTPHTDGWARVWFSDHDGQGRGFDPVYDTYMFLRCTGRVIGKLGPGKGEFGKSLQIHWPENGIDNIKMSWWDFKCLVLWGLFGKEYSADLKELCETLGIMKGKKIHNPHLRKRCFELIKDGTALDDFQQVRVGIFEQNAEASEDEVDPDELELEDEDDE